jgi:hypothetical protein
MAMPRPSADNPFLTARDQPLVYAATARPPVTRFAQSAVVLLRLNEFMKELSHFALRCH